MHPHKPGREDKHFFFLTQNNQRMNRENMKNPFYAEVSISRFQWSAYLQTTISEEMVDSLPTVCLHDFLPGTVQKIALDQVDNTKIAILYRVLKDHGYLHRVRIYDLTKMPCQQGKHAFNNFEDIEDHFEYVQDHESQYLREDFDEETNLFEDFVMPTNGKITALNMYGN